MAKSVLDIIIRTMKQGGADKETIKGLTEVKNTVTSAVGAFAAFAGAAFVVDKALDATVGKLVSYASEVREVQYATGATAEEASRLIQVADDTKISYEQLSKAMKTAVKDGITPNIDGLAQLSDEYLALAPGQERASFLLDKFGKSGAAMAELMSKGGDAIREMSDGIDSSLVLTQQAVDQARQYEIALDGLNEQWEAYALNVGQRAVPALTKLIEGTNIYLSLAESENETYTRGAINRNAIEMAMQKETSALDTLSVSYSENALAMQEAQTVAEDLAINYDNLLKSISNMQSETDRYNETQEEANAAIAQANADYKSGEITLEERNSVLEENKQKLDENAAAHKEWAAQTVFAFAHARAAADGEITEGEGRVLIDIGQKLGLFDEQTAEAMQSVNESFANVDTSDAQATIDALNDSLVALTGRNWNITVTTTTVTETPTGSGDPDGYATGGAFRAGRPMRVEQDEILVPSYSGVVLTRTDAMRLMSGQGGGANNSKRINIYGLTIVAKGSVMDELDSLK